MEPLTTYSTVKENMETSNISSFEEVENKLEQMFAGIEDVLNIKDTKIQISKNKNNLESNMNSITKIEQKNQTKNSHLINNLTQIKNKRKILSKTLGIETQKTDKKKILKKKKNILNEKVLSRIKNIREEHFLNEFKYKGPYIQFKSNGFINVMNSAFAEDELEKQNKAKKPILNHTKIERKKIRGLHVSTLSTKYDADTTDVSWLCVFCKKGPHKCGLGDLFGPYIVNKSFDEFEIQQHSTQNYDNGRKNNKSEMCSQKLSNFPIIEASNSKVILYNDNKLEEHLSNFEDDENFSGMIKVSETAYEIWLHEDCIIWTSGIYLIGSKIMGLENAVWCSTKNICSACSMYGAMICCLKRGCNEMSHITCAKSHCWSISEEDFQTFCQNHSEQNNI